MLPLWAEWVECTDPEPYIKRVFKNSDRVFEHPFFSLFAPLRTPGSSEKRQHQKAHGPFMQRANYIFDPHQRYTDIHCRNQAESFVIHMCIAIVRFKDGGASWPLCFQCGVRLSAPLFSELCRSFPLSAAAQAGLLRRFGIILNTETLLF